MKQTNENQFIRTDGAFMIEDERLTAIQQGRTPRSDVDAYPPGMMAQLAAFIITGASDMMPDEFPPAVVNKYRNMPFKRRLAIAGQFIAAEIDAQILRGQLKVEASKGADAYRNVGNYDNHTQATPHTCISSFTIGDVVRNEFGLRGRVMEVRFSYDPQPSYKIVYENGSTAIERDRDLKLDILHPSNKGRV